MPGDSGGRAASPPGVRKSTATVVKRRRRGADDGAAGVREPRRPVPPTDHDAAEALMPGLPADATDRHTDVSGDEFPQLGPPLGRLSTAAVPYVRMSDGHN